MMKKSNERGVALLFALGMLTILLVTGLAFVANALSARKVAGNNSARSQARMFAQSALSRVVASVMMYQYQTQKGTGEFPENFDCVQSHGVVNVSSSEELSLRDGLVSERESGTGNAGSARGNTSLLALPEDDTVVARSVARQFNQSLAGNNWNGSWVYFYNTCDTGENVDRRIIGRAAWKVVSNSPQILAPVFLSGHLRTDGAYNWRPSSYRWGREIDEVSTVSSDSIFNPVRTTIPENSTSLVMQNYETLFLNLNITEDAKRRWLERWFIPDSESSNSLADPTEIIPEVYSYRQGGNKVVQLMRFNISELADPGKYGVSAAGADPWYARFGISSTPGSIKGNDEAFLSEYLTVDSPEAAMKDEFDYELDAKERPSLPFLRRIGNAGEIGSFADIATFRKQIAANFNDYCDADSLPTSDADPRKWDDSPSWDADGKPTFPAEPNFTGNELTPYLYEVGFGLGIHPDKDGSVDVSKNGLSITGGGGRGANSVTVKGWLGINPVFKLANVYNFDPSGKIDSFSAGVDVGKITLKLRPSVVSLTVNYTYSDGLTGSLTLDKREVVEGMNFSTLTATVEPGVFQTLKVENVAASNMTNTDGSNPYPLMFNDISSVDSSKPKQISFSDKLSFTITEDVVRALRKDSDPAFPAGATVTSFTMSVDAVELSKVVIPVHRMYLMAKESSGAAYGVDYVRSLGDVSWSTESDGDTFPGKKIPFKDGSNIPGFFVGGIRNYDPRQNLNKGDWYAKLSVAPCENYVVIKNNNIISEAMAIDSAGVGIANVANNDDGEKVNEDLLFRPYPATGDDEKRDLELAAQPGCTGTANDKYISTAFIRNAPMMSPWEIGFIHRGIRWQTINIRRACNPDNNGSAISISGHRPHQDKWDLAGTSYIRGDGGILDQIKMTEKCATYGKINVNRLRSNDPLFNAALDINIANALFENISYGQSVSNFYTISTRDSSENFQIGTAQDGTLIGSFNGFAAMTASRSAHTSRAQFIEWAAGKMETAFGTMTPENTDAAQEEIIGKTVNLICAENSSPSQIQVVVIAQSIRDVGGSQFKRVNKPSEYSGSGVTKDDTSGTVTKTCEFGQFDFAEHSSSYDKNVYFDEITGEVKMLVTIERNINTGRMVIRRIDYLE